MLISLFDSFFVEDDRCYLDTYISFRKMVNKFKRNEAHMTYPIRVRASALILQNDAILLVEFDDGNGLHYNLPGGGVEKGETLIDAVKREAREEASVDIEVGDVAFLYEYAPFKNKNKYGSIHSLTTIFDCTLKEGEEPSISPTPDSNQTAVKWIPLNELSQIVLYPNIREEIVAYVQKRRTIKLIEEQQLKEYEL